jgi:hypothetical protein
VRFFLVHLEGIQMKTRLAIFAVAMLAAVGSARAIYSVRDKGLWPESWPKELEPLRTQAQTYTGPTQLIRRYLIPFTKREEFEAAWPYLLKVKTKGAPVFLVPGPRTDFFAIQPAGVLIHTPPVDIDRKAHPEAPLGGDMDPGSKWANTNYIELAVDGHIVDLNRIQLPSDCQIIDERFKKTK